jgi:hypothetical protein
MLSYPNFKISTREKMVKPACPISFRVSSYGNQQRTRSMSVRLQVAHGPACRVRTRIFSFIRINSDKLSANKLLTAQHFHITFIRSLFLRSKADHTKQLSCVTNNQARILSLCSTVRKRRWWLSDMFTTRCSSSQARIEPSGREL